MIKTIPLQSGQAHFRFRTLIAGRQVSLRVNWLERYGYFSVDVTIDGTLAIAGRGLHPDVNLLKGTGVPGSLHIQGAEPTPDNLGRNAKLVYDNE